MAATGYYLLDHEQAIAQCGYPRRNGAKASGTIILHDAEGGTDLAGADMGAENVANFIRTRSTYGSYHRLVDRDTRIKMAPIDYETWHSVPDNPWSVGISVAWNKADLARMSRAERRSYYVPLAREVLDVRAEFARRGITVPIDRMLTAAETQARKPGISTHSRTDPTRRSDPFGTGSVYEAEFLAVLAELAAVAPTTTPGGFMADLTESEQKAVYNAATAKVHDEALDRWLSQPDADRVEIALLRRIEGRLIARDAAPVEVDVDADAVADALVERLPKPIVEQLLTALTTRLAQ